MNANRKADLQRRLTLAAIPKPPAGLAERIKTDIPKHLPTSTELDRKRLSSAVAFNMRVAASVLLLVGSLFFALHLLNHAYQEEEDHRSTFEVALKQDRAPAAPPLPKPPRQTPQVVTSTEQPPAIVEPPKPRPAEKQAPTQTAESRDELRYQYDNGEEAKDAKKERDDETAKKLKALGYTSGRVAESASTPAGGAASPSAAAAVNEPRSKVAVATQPIPAPAPAPPPAAEMAKSAPVMTDFVPSAQAADLAFAPVTVFGYSMTTTRSLEAAPLVQRFAGPDTRPSRGVQLDADVAVAPFDAAKDVLRISIDTAAKSGSDDATPTPVAADAQWEIEFDPNAVVSHRALTGDPSTKERLLVEGVSVTAVYELELKPSLSRRAHVATVRLRYRSLPDGHTRTLERVLRVRDLASSFDSASSRLKRAALAAALGDTRSRGGDTAAIAEKARALGFNDLAALASR